MEREASWRAGENQVDISILRARISSRAFALPKEMDRDANPEKRPREEGQDSDLLPPQSKARHSMEPLRQSHVVHVVDHHVGLQDARRASNGEHHKDQRHSDIAGGQNSEQNWDGIGGGHCEQGSATRDDRHSNSCRPHSEKQNERHNDRIDNAHDEPPRVNHYNPVRDPRGRRPASDAKTESDVCVVEAISASAALKRHNAAVPVVDLLMSPPPRVNTAAARDSARGTAPEIAAAEPPAAVPEDEWCGPDDDALMAMMDALEPPILQTPARHPV